MAILQKKKRNEKTVGFEATKSYYIQNMKKQLLFIQDENKKVIIKLMPLECTKASIPPSTIALPSIQVLIRKKYITLQEVETEIVREYAKDVGQFYKIGTIVYIKGKNNLKGEVIEYNPIKTLYTIAVFNKEGNKTGGEITKLEGDISTKPFKINIKEQEEDDENIQDGDVESEDNVNIDLEDSKVNIIEGSENPEADGVDASKEIDSQKDFAEKLDKEKVNIVNNEQKGFDKVEKAKGKKRK